MQKKFDLILFGATSFVGKITCRYLLETYGIDKDLKWGAAGRSKTKLRELGLPDENLLVADVRDTDSLKNMVNQSKVILTTVGPYGIYGESLIRLCAENGTHYGDLTGEVTWVAEMISRYDSIARSSGAMIINCCGFDSVPSDLGVHYLQREAVARLGSPCTQIEMIVKKAKGGVSGGTVASLLNMVEKANDDPNLLKVLVDPYALCQSNHLPNPEQKDLHSAQYSELSEGWQGPFVMATINTRVVHRSHSLLKQAWGKDFLYNEAVATGKGLKGWVGAQGVTISLAAIMTLSRLTLTRSALKKLLPKPGEGPSQKLQDTGFYDLHFFGQTDDHQKIHTKVTGDRDPGYGSTAKIFAEAGICLTKESSSLQGGFSTPAVALGDNYLDRLVSHAGLTFETL